MRTDFITYLAYYYEYYTVWIKHRPTYYNVELKFKCSFENKKKCLKEPTYTPIRLIIFHTINIENIMSNKEHFSTKFNLL